MPPLNSTTTTTTTTTNLTNPSPLLHPEKKQQKTILRRKSTIHHLRHWLSHHLPSSTATPAPPRSSSKSIPQATGSKQQQPPTKISTRPNPLEPSSPHSVSPSATSSTSTSTSTSPNPSSENLHAEYSAYCRAFSAGLTGESFRYVSVSTRDGSNGCQGCECERESGEQDLQDDGAAAAAAPTTTTAVAHSDSHPHNHKHTQNHANREFETRPDGAATTAAAAAAAPPQPTPRTHPRKGRPWRIDEIRRPEDLWKLSGHHHSCQHHQHHDQYPHQDHNHNHKHKRNHASHQDHHELQHQQQQQHHQQKTDNTPQNTPNEAVSNNTPPIDTPIIPTPQNTPQTLEILHWMRRGRSSFDSTTPERFDHEDDRPNQPRHTDTDSDVSTGPPHAKSTYPPRLSPPLRVLTPARYEQSRRTRAHQNKKFWWGTVQSYWTRMRPRSEAARREAKGNPPVSYGES
ncbi:uncharacterized protein BP01DRAFT_89812 [Aspergillus saccharolyticus JOP 1030-1]|uniref:Uncharacterized protein n=1 Tax=Aspergillus saccharolyticus JOP 1030-1 TaxID=1450539 RepID=A0A318Z9W8_9EURO|nr:hypothetical protein BP01DRAFT_89812 [Aspergillus saccharolyticus JOP 1030-1]PYH44166.1 hypothetical protein BP01DRAFT_89812 [Aspergillus saccharolyticus JOP 1030-1]